MIKSLTPLIGQEPKILILGSIAGAESLMTEQYYAFKQNRFFPIMYKFFRITNSIMSYEEKCKMLTDGGVALWDSICECTRDNSSLDSAIKDEKPNDIAGLLKQYPSIKLIITNGKKSTQVFDKYFDKAEFSGVECVGLNSTSPANARCSFDMLYSEWSNTLMRYLR